MIQAIDNGGLSRVYWTNEKWLDTSFILNVEITGFADGFQMGCDKREE